MVHITLEISVNLRYDINQTLRPNKPLLLAFGYEKCADQSVIQQTINAATEANIDQLEQAINQIFKENNQTILLLDENETEQPLTIDIDLSALPASKASEGSKKGYVAKKKNQYTRQLARVLVAETSEIITQSLYPGNTLSLTVFKEMVYKMEHYLELETKVNKKQIKLRIDAGFGTDYNLNFALWRGYHIMAKIYSGKRAKKLVHEGIDLATILTSELRNKFFAPLHLCVFALNILEDGTST
jgi:hypothetical protein